MGIKLAGMRNSSTVGILRGTIFSFHGSEIMGWQIKDINILIYFGFGFFINMVGNLSPYLCQSRG